MCENEDLYDDIFDQRNENQFAKAEFYDLYENIHNPEVAETALEKVKNLTSENEKFRTQNTQLKTQISILNTINLELKTKNTNLEKNVKDLILTSRVEINRKNEQVRNLRAELDNVLFKRAARNINARELEDLLRKHRPADEPYSKLPTKPRTVVKKVELVGASPDLNTGNRQFVGKKRKRISLENNSSSKKVKTEDNKENLVNIKTEAPTAATNSSDNTSSQPKLEEKANVKLNLTSSISADKLVTKSVTVNNPLVKPGPGTNHHLKSGPVTNLHVKPVQITKPKLEALDIGLISNYVKDKPRRSKKQVDSASATAASTVSNDVISAKSRVIPAINSTATRPYSASTRAEVINKDLSKQPTVAKENQDKTSVKEVKNKHSRTRITFDNRKTTSKPSEPIVEPLIQESVKVSEDDISEAPIAKTDNLPLKLFNITSVKKDPITPVSKGLKCEEFKTPSYIKHKDAACKEPKNPVNRSSLTLTPKASKLDFKERKSLKSSATSTVKHNTPVSGSIDVETPVFSSTPISSSIQETPATTASPKLKKSPLDSENNFSVKVEAEDEASTSSKLKSPVARSSSITKPQEWALGHQLFDILETKLEIATRNRSQERTGKRECKKKGKKETVDKRRKTIEKDKATDRKKEATPKQIETDKKRETAIKSETPDEKKETTDIKNETIDIKKETIDMKKEKIDVKKKTIYVQKETSDGNKDSIDENKETTDINKAIENPDLQDADASFDEALYGSTRWSCEYHCKGFRTRDDLRMHRSKDSCFGKKNESPKETRKLSGEAEYIRSRTPSGGSKKRIPSGDQQDFDGIVVKTHEEKNKCVQIDNEKKCLVEDQVMTDEKRKPIKSHKETRKLSGEAEYIRLRTPSGGSKKRIPSGDQKDFDGIVVKTHEEKNKCVKIDNEKKCLVKDQVMTDEKRKPIKKRDHLQQTPGVLGNSLSGIIREPLETAADKCVKQIEKNSSVDSVELKAAIRSITPTDDLLKLDIEPCDAFEDELDFEPEEPTNETGGSVYFKNLNTNFSIPKVEKAEASDTIKSTPSKSKAAEKELDRKNDKQRPAGKERSRSRNRADRVSARPRKRSRSKRRKSRSLSRRRRSKSRNRSRSRNRRRSGKSPRKNSVTRKRSPSRERGRNNRRRRSRSRKGSESRKRSQTPRSLSRKRSGEKRRPSSRSTLEKLSRRSQSLSPERLRSRSPEVDLDKIEIEDGMSLDSLQKIKQQLMGKMCLNDDLEPIRNEEIEEGEITDTEDEEVQDILKKKKDGVDLRQKLVKKRPSSKTRTGSDKENDEKIVKTTRDSRNRLQENIGMKACLKEYSAEDIENKLIPFKKRQFHELKFEELKIRKQIERARSKSSTPVRSVSESSASDCPPQNISASSCISSYPADNPMADLKMSPMVDMRVSPIRMKSPAVRDRRVSDDKRCPRTRSRKVSHYDQKVSPIKLSLRGVVIERPSSSSSEANVETVEVILEKVENSSQEGKLMQEDDNARFPSDTCTVATSPKETNQSEDIRKDLCLTDDSDFELDSPVKMFTQPSHISPFRRPEGPLDLSSPKRPPITPKSRLKPAEADISSPQSISSLLKSPLVSHSLLSPATTKLRSNLSFSQAITSTPSPHIPTSSITNSTQVPLCPFPPSTKPSKTTENTSEDAVKPQLKAKKRKSRLGRSATSTTET